MKNLQKQLQNEKNKLAHLHPFQVVGFHGCDKEVGLNVVNGRTKLKASNNIWDWLGEGIYFWEQNPLRALEYAIESSTKKQFNKIPIRTPFVIGALIELGNCLNLIELESLAILKEAYLGLGEIYLDAGKEMLKNESNNRKLDSAVFKHLHKSREENDAIPFDTIRCAFNEGELIYPGANFTTRLHMEISVINHEMIHGYYLPYPLEKYDPYLNEVNSN
jgi:hypothetical protein